MRIMMGVLVAVLLLLAACGGQTYSTRAVEPTAQPTETASVSGALPAETSAQPTPGTASCTDSDGGIDKSTKGVLVFVDETGKSTTYEDTCIRPNLLLENFCDNGTPKNEKLNCDKIACDNGICA